MKNGFVLGKQELGVLTQEVSAGKSVWQPHEGVL